MLFNSPVFIFVFLPVTALLCFVIRARAGREAALGFLVLASLFFYGWWNPLYLPLLIGLTVFNFLLARLIMAERSRPNGGRATALVTFGVSVDLLSLAYFKYADFFIGSVNAVAETDIPLQHVILPLAISFFTFQKIAYLVDARRGEVEPHSFLEYSFFVMFFPQLIAGPIVHHKEIFAQTKLNRSFNFDWTNISIGATIFLIGLFKKVVLADNVAPVATHVFSLADQGEHVTFLQAWQGTVSYSLQIYFDFSGYSDMAIGAARIFGIRLPLNFHSPYQSENIIDFWRRWHMTLSRFLRDYLYISLGGNRKGKYRRYLNLFATMAIGGLWHGAAWTFALWGAMHGLYLIINHGWRALGIAPINRWWSRLVARLLTFFAVAMAWVVFRAETMEGAFTIYRSMFSSPLGMPLSDFAVSACWLVFWLAVVWYWPNTQQWLARANPAFNYSWADRKQDPLLLPVEGTRWREKLLRWRPGIPHAVAVGGAGALAFLSLQRISEFLYFQF
ncbi:D-alanyl-lipoteichoic acid acyltransferase DltB (MBOAT superfamily) [Parvibaculum indicum]|uniref:MBOAT family O-acyltransferase n=1 Tax=Parvibaculum indicum TaxID=562969 RepID=UPI0014226B08|nr:MBOAT family protein [Parvibaculum indicum]NIJ39799.1 D-alanyl-lipoteichoic acid acyltransferase DltB (MBOAT superfamily) [Parvibaculum indicum]